MLRSDPRPARAFTLVELPAVSRVERAAFTLVELLVVIGIIAVLIGIRLPVLSGVAARGRDLKCQANLRSIMQAVHGYAAEHRGSMPWGYIFNRSDPVSWLPEVGNDDEVICWASLVSHYMDRSKPVVIRSSDASTSDIKALLSPALQCPEADLGRPHAVSYAMNIAVGSTPYEDRRAAAPPELLGRSIKQTQMLKDTAVLWDTTFPHRWDWQPDIRGGWDIDDQRIWTGANIPQWRYYTARDAYAHVPPGNLAHNKPVLMNAAQSTWRNRDPAPGETWPYNGNLRLRHRKNTTCNVAFADGSVRLFTGRFRPDKTMHQHDALRRYFMVKWPTGVPPHPDYPH